MMPKIHISQVRKGVKIIPYFRNPTEEEIKFGYGAIHYRDFYLKKCFNSDGFLRSSIIAKNDGLKYKLC